MHALRFSDRQLDVVQTAARSLRPEQRAEYLQAIAAQLSASDEHSDTEITTAIEIAVVVW
jgi:hypothetical protein